MSEAQIWSVCLPEAVSFRTLEAAGSRRHLTHAKCNYLSLYIYIYIYKCALCRQANGIYICIYNVYYIYYIYPKKLQFAAYGQFDWTIKFCGDTAAVLIVNANVKTKKKNKKIRI